MIFKKILVLLLISWNSYIKELYLCEAPNKSRTPRYINKFINLKLPTKLMKNKVFLLSTFFILAFLINFFYESLHAIYLYTCCTDLLAPAFVKLITVASVGDAMYLTIMYVIIALITRSFVWITNLRKNNLFLFSLLGLIFAIIIEIKGVYILNKWSYSPLMPTLFGIGLSPLVQLTLTGLITLIITRKLFKN